LEFWVLDFGSGVRGLGFGVRGSDLWCGDWDLGLELMFRVYGLGFRM